MEFIPFSNFITALIIFSIGVSLFFKKNVRESSYNFFLLFAFCLAGIFLFNGLSFLYTTQFFNNLKYTFVILAGLAGISFFNHTLRFKTGYLLNLIFGIIAILAILFFLFDSYLPLFSESSGFKPYLSLICGIIYSIAIIAIIYLTYIDSPSGYLQKKFSFTLVSTFLFFFILLLSQIIKLKTIPIVTSEAITLVYIYFLSQTLFHAKFLELKQIFLKFSIFLSGALFIALIIWGLLILLSVSHPSKSPDNYLKIELFNFSLFFTLFVSSIIVLLFQEHFSRITEKILLKLIAGNPQNFNRQLKKLLLKLDRMHANEIYIGDTIKDVFSKSLFISSSSLYTTRNELEYNRIFSFPGNEIEKLSRSSHSNFIERLNLGQLVFRQDLEHELHRLKQGWAVVLGAKQLNSILNTMELLDTNIVIPIFIKNNLQGFLCLCHIENKSGYPLSTINLLQQLGNRIGNTLNYTKEYQNLRQKDKLALLGKMSAVLAHEIRNPISSIKGSAQLLEIEDEESKEFLEIIMEETDRLNRVVNNFLQFSRNSNPESFSRLDLGKLIRKTLILVNNESDNQIQFKGIENGEEYPIRGNPDKLKQVLINLLNNAKDATAEEKKAKIEIEINKLNTSRGKFIEIMVRDNGYGISKENQKSIFEPFFTTKAEGTGLGLPVISKIIDEHNGQITVYSNENEGTQFKLLFKC
ncbi:MAG: ATP-binding protein [Deltaproteobacteria bacterium]|nr:ATP-binding protein [Deltaproteobacteria bacterium]